MTDDEYLAAVRLIDPDAHYADDTVGGMRVLVTTAIPKDAIAYVYPADVHWAPPAEDA